MRKIYLEGPLGQKFGEEWNLNVNSPSEALTAIMAQRPGMRQFITDGKRRADMLSFFFMKHLTAGWVTDGIDIRSTMRHQ